MTFWDGPLIKGQSRGKRFHANTSSLDNQRWNGFPIDQTKRLRTGLVLQSFHICDNKIKRALFWRQIRGSVNSGQLRTQEKRGVVFRAETDQVMSVEHDLSRKKNMYVTVMP